MTQVAELLEKLPPYKGDKRLIKRRQFTYDIIRDIMRKHRETMAHYDKIAWDFWKGDQKKTAEALYYFAKKNLPYKVEKTYQQTSKTPAAILEERNDFGNDCKHYASFCVGIGEALRRKGYPVKCFYRFGSYHPDQKAPGHVFAVFVDDGKEIWVDPVPEIGGFDRRFIKPVFVIDKMPPMSKNGHSIGALYDISGIPIPSNKTIAGWSPTVTINGTHWLDQLPTSRSITFDPGIPGMGKAKKKGLKIKIKAPHIKIQPGKLLKKLVGATPRNAYLLVLKMNVFDLAVQIHEKIKNNPAAWKKLHDFWQNIGGNPNKLATAINAGVNTYNKLHPGHKINGDLYANVEEGNERIGVLPVAGAAAALAAAAPIIVAIKNVLKSLGIDTELLHATAKKADVAAAAKHNSATHDKGDGNPDIQDDGSADHGNGVSTKVTTDGAGNQKMEIKVKDPTGDGSDDSADDSGDQAEEPGAQTTTAITKSKIKSASDNDFTLMVDNVKNFVAEHKMWIIGGTVVFMAIVIIPKLVNHKKRRR